MPKQIEMDAIVQEIYMAMDTNSELKSTILVLCGDHGMNDAGNHGGSAESETSTALVFISPKIKSLTEGLDSPILLKDGDFQYYTTVEQSDIAPTIAALLGFPVPLNSLGVLIVGMLGFWGNGKQPNSTRPNIG